MSPRAERIRDALEWLAITLVCLAAAVGLPAAVALGVHGVLS